MDEREKELVQQALNGNSSAFEELVLPYRQSLLHLAYRMTGNIEEAMDIAQETILRCFQYLHRFDTEKTFRNWLFQIALNLSHDARRKKSVEQRYVKELCRPNYRLGNGDNHNSNFEPIFNHPAEEKSDLRLDVNKCLSCLSPKERQVFILRDLQGLSIKETARLLKTSSLSVRVNLSSARRKIRQAIEGSLSKPILSGEDK